jgi:predicted Zn-dependent peptidase
MCKGESAGISEFGYIEDLPSLNAKNLYEHYKKIVTTSPIDIFVVGDCDIDDVKAKISENISRYDFAIEPIEIEKSEVWFMKDFEQYT